MSSDGRTGPPLARHLQPASFRLENLDDWSESADNQTGFLSNRGQSNYGSDMQRILLTLVLLLSITRELQAQRRVTPYQPATPTTSPYLYLTLPETGALPNYQAFVEPLQNQQRINVSHQAEIGRLNQEQLDYGPATGVAPTGTASVYNNLSHYYPGSNPSSGTQRPGAPRAAGGRNVQRTLQSPYQAAPVTQPGMAAGMGGGFF
jgi:hypothetical protein